MFWNRRSQEQDDLNVSDLYSCIMKSEGPHLHIRSRRTWLLTCITCHHCDKIFQFKETFLISGVQIWWLYHTQWAVNSDASQGRRHWAKGVCYGFASGGLWTQLCKNSECIKQVHLARNTSWFLYQFCKTSIIRNNRIINSSSKLFQWFLRYSVIVTFWEAAAQK